MKQKVTAILALSMSLAIQSLYSAQSSQLTNDLNNKLIYCPSSITCDGNSNACTFKADTPEYWEKTVGAAGGTPAAGTYRFAEASAHKSRSEYANPVYCSYKIGDKWISLRSKPEANLETYDGDSNWKFNNNSTTGRCSSSTYNSLNCPLEKHHVLIIHNINISDGVVASANNVNITSQSIGRGQYGKASYNISLPACGLSDICQIDITSPNGGYYGYVIVNMNDQMNILGVYSLRPNEILLKQVESFNAIEVSYPFYS